MSRREDIWIARSVVDYLAEVWIGWLGLDFELGLTTFPIRVRSFIEHLIYMQLEQAPKSTDKASKLRCEQRSTEPNGGVQKGDWPKSERSESRR